LKTITLVFVDIELHFGGLGSASLGWRRVRFSRSIPKNPDEHATNEEHPDGPEGKEQ